MKKKLMLIVVAIMAFFMIAGASDASAKAKVYKSHVYAAKQLKHHYFKHSYTKYSKKGLIYTTRSLKHWNHKGANYKKTAWTTNQSVTVKKSNGKTAVYYYIKNKKNGIKGWIWRGYLASKPVKTTKSSTPTASTTMRAATKAETKKEAAEWGWDTDNDPDYKDGYKMYVNPAGEKAGEKERADLKASQAKNAARSKAQYDASDKAIDAVLAAGGTWADATAASEAAIAKAGKDFDATH